jgi:beta-lactamase regulating signal transducer with metallopeptidase domain
MSSRYSSIALWLADSQLLAAVLLLVVLCVLFAVRQPARRLAIAKATLGALAALAVLCAIPGWSVIHLMTSDVPPPLNPVSVRIVQPEEPPVNQFIPHINVDRIPASPRTPQPTIAQRLQTEPPRLSSWPKRFVLAYALGSALVSGWLLYGVLLANRLLRGTKPAPAWLEAELRRLAPGAPVARTLISSSIQTPVALGTRRPAIVLPEALISNSPGEPSEDHSTTDLTPILAHELAHLRNGDLRTLAASRLLLILFWPQPLYWWLRRLIRLDQETLADAAASEVTSRVLYAEQLVKWAGQTALRPNRRLATAVGLWEGPSQLRRRVAILLNENFAIISGCSRRWRNSALVGLLVVAGCLSLVTIGSGSSQALAKQTARQAESAEAQTTKAPGKSNQQSDDSSARAEKTRGDQSSPSSNLVQPFTLVPRPRLSAGPRSILQSPATMSPDVQPSASSFDAVDLAIPQPSGLAQIGIVRAVPPEAADAAWEQSDAFLQMFGYRNREGREPNTLQGRCLDQNGNPLAGVEVAVYRKLPNSNRSEFLRRAKTDDQGRFQFETIAPVSTTALATAILSGEPLIDWAAHLKGRTSRTGGLSESLMVQHGQAIDIVMPPGESLRGRLTDPQGRPVAGALVAKSNLVPDEGIYTATSNANGEFVIDDLAAFDLQQALRDEERQRQLEDEYLAEHGSVFRSSSVPRFLVAHPRFLPDRLPETSIPGRADLVLTPIDPNGKTESQQER